ncbi:MAG: sugar phosphate isomerase/epimerase [Planctomycetes bacterium]|nr:sugar phosphate isomerase/epimerase [Planctomycetota bacterium]
MEPLTVGVCSWSIDRRQPVQSIRVAGQRYGARAVHLGFFDAETLQATSADALRRVADEVGVEICATFAAFWGEDYSSLTAVAASGGYLPDEHWPTRRDHTLRVADLSAELGAALLAIHVGTIPDDPSADAYRKLAARTAEIADALAERRLTLLLETGRESAATLSGFIDGVAKENVKVSYDPGNMVIYGTGDPVRSIATLGGRIGLVHLKDASASSQPGTDWGCEATLGTGEADIPRVVSRLRATGYSGPLIVERTAGRGDPGDLSESVDYLRSLLV